VSRESLAAAVYLEGKLTGAPGIIPFIAAWTFGSSLALAGKILLFLLCLVAFAMFGGSAGGGCLMVILAVTCFLLITAGGAAQGIGIAMLVVFLFFGWLSKNSG
jgi:hypothetical protein